MEKKHDEELSELNQVTHDYRELAGKYNLLRQKAIKNQQFGRKIAKSTPGATDLFAEGMSGTEDLGEEIYMRKELEGLHTGAQHPNASLGISVPSGMKMQVPGHENTGSRGKCMPQA